MPLAAVAAIECSSSTIRAPGRLASPTLNPSFGRTDPEACFRSGEPADGGKSLRRPEW